MALLLPQKNRNAFVLLLLIPFGCDLLLAGIGNLFDHIAVKTFANVLYGTTFALTAFWLLMPWLRKRSWIVTGILLLLLLGVVNCAVIFPKADLKDDELTRYLIFMSLGALIISLAVSITGWLCRKRFSFLKYTLWIITILAVETALLMTVLYFMEELDLDEVIIFWFAGSFGICSVILPYLLLSAITPFFARRMEAFVGAQSPVPPVSPKAQAPVPPQNEPPVLR
jgi:hypothetical protein